MGWAGVAVPQTGGQCRFWLGSASVLDGRANSRARPSYVLSGRSASEHARGKDSGWPSALASWGALETSVFQTLALGGKAAAVTPFTALYPLVTIALAVLFLRERLNGVQAAGAFLSLLALYCFNVGADAAVLTPWLAVALIPIGFWA